MTEVRKIGVVFVVSYYAAIKAASHFDNEPLHCIVSLVFRTSETTGMLSLMITAGHWTKFGQIDKRRQTKITNL